MGLKFVGLHAHTGFSIGDAIGAPREHFDFVIKNAGEDSMAHAVTDHGTASSFGYVSAAQGDFKKKGIKFRPIYGCEVYYHPDLEQWKKDKQDKEEGQSEVFAEDEQESKSKLFDPVKRRHHLVVLAQNQVGLKNLYRLVTNSFRHGFYRFPRCDLRMLEKFNEGLIVSSACVAGLPNYLVSREHTNGKQAVFNAFDKELKPLLDLFSGRSYLEIQFNSLEEQRLTNDYLIEYSKLVSVPLIATADSHYPDPGLWKDREIYKMLGRQTRGQTADANMLPKTIDDLKCELYPKNGDQMFAEYKKHYSSCVDEQLIKEAIERTHKIAWEQIEEVSTDKTVKLPVHNALKSSAETLEEECKKALKQKGLDSQEKYVKQLDYELKIINDKNFADYFLVLKDAISTLRGHMLIGPGRGCLSGDTLVRVPYGLKNIKDIKTNDIVFDGDGNQCKVSNVFEYNIDEDLIEIGTYYGGKPTRLTPDHKVLVAKAKIETNKAKLARGYRYSRGKEEPAWVRADEIETGDMVVCPKTFYKNELEFIEIKDTVYKRRRNAGGVKSLARKIGVSPSAVRSFLHQQNKGRGARGKVSAYFEKNIIDLNEIMNPHVITSVPGKINVDFDFGKLLGLWISDGWVHKRRDATVGFCCRRSEDRGEISKLIKHVFGQEPVVRDHKGKDLRQFFINHKGLARWFKSFFPEYQYTSGTKYIPCSLFHTSEEFRTGLLHGLWAGDGTHRGRTKYSSTSKKLAEGVFALLASLGFHVGIRESQRKEKRSNFRKNPIWTEYSVVSAPLFENIKNAIGSAYDGKYYFSRVRYAKKVSGHKKVYDFTVPSTNSYVTDSFVVHNSGAGSLVNYLLDITQIDPLKYGLIFERFLNPNRKELPDIDNDLELKDDALYILRDKFGKDNVLPVSNYNTLQLKSLIKDVSKLYGIEFQEVNNVTRVMEEEARQKILDEIGNDQKLYEFTYDRAIKHSPTLVAFLEKYPNIGKHIDNLYKEIKAVSKHAGGLVIVNDSESSMPVIKTKGEEQVPYTQGLTAQHLDYFGLVKYDFLGLATLRVIRRCIELVLRNQGIEPNIENVNNFVNEKLHPDVINTKDELVFSNVYHKGKFPGIFQFAEPGVQSFAMSAKPKSVEDISALTATWRPGALSANGHKNYLKNSTTEVKYEHKVLEEVLGTTRGVLIYQEQFMSLANKLGGFSFVESDELRKMLVKPSHELGDDLRQKRAEAREKFIAGCVSSGLSQERATDLWDREIIGFASYGFNFSHSVSYAFVSYQCSWLFTYHEKEWIQAYLEFDPNLEDAINVVQSVGYKIAKIDAAKSSREWFIDDNKTIYPSLLSVKGIGESALEELATKKPASCSSLYDFLYEIVDDKRKWRWSKFNKKAFDALIMLEAFQSLDCVGQGKLFETYKHMMVVFTEEFERIKKGKISLEELAAKHQDIGDWTSKERIEFQKNLTGTYDKSLIFTEKNNEVIKKFNVRTIQEIDQYPKLTWFVVMDLEKKTTKTGKPYQSITATDMNGVKVRFNYFEDEQFEKDCIYVGSLYNDGKWVNSKRGGKFHKLQ